MNRGRPNSEDLKHAEEICLESGKKYGINQARTQIFRTELPFKKKQPKPGCPVFMKTGL